jgi:hypothetical protein
VPVLNGTNHDEERIFVSIGLTVSQGTDVPIPETPVTPGNYQANIAAALGVTAARAAQIAAEYPPLLQGCKTAGLLTPRLRIMRCFVHRHSRMTSHK